MKLYWIGPSSDEVEALARDLVERHGAEAYEEALRLSGVLRSLGARKNEAKHRMAAHRIKMREAAGDLYEMKTAAAR